MLVESRANNVPQSVTVETLSGVSATLGVDASSTVSSLAEEIATLWSLSQDEIQLVSRGRPLSPTASLVEAGIENGSCLQLSVRACAGGGVCCKRIKLKQRNSVADELDRIEEMEAQREQNPPPCAKQEAMRKHHLRNSITIHRQSSRHDFHNESRSRVEDVDDDHTRLQIHYSENWAHRAKVAAVAFMQSHSITPEDYEFELHDCHGKVFNPKMKLPKDKTIDEYFPLAFVFHKKLPRTSSGRLTAGLSSFSLSPRRNRSRSPSPRKSPRKIAPAAGEQPSANLAGRTPSRALAERHPSIECALASFTHMPWLRELTNRSIGSENEREALSPSKRER